MAQDRPAVTQGAGAAVNEAPILEMHQISKSFSGIYALKAVSFSVRRGEIHALCGENGAGKSTLMKVLSGNHPFGSYEGTIRIDGRDRRFRSIAESEEAGVAIIYQELSLIRHLSVAENIFLGREPNVAGWIDRHKAFKASRDLLSVLGLDVAPQEKVEALGMGQQQMVEIAKALSKNARILVLDEPTSSLSESEVATLMRILRELKSRGVTCILISHKLNEVFEIADRITVLRDGTAVGTRDTVSTTIPQIVADMVGRELDKLYPYKPRDLGPPVFEVRGLTVQHPNLPQKHVLSDISFSVRVGEILGIFGLVGAGRTELLTSLFGVFPGQRRGDVLLGGKSIRVKSPQQAIGLGLGLVSEDRKRYGLVLDASVLKNLTLAVLHRLSRFGIVPRRGEATVARKAVNDLRVKAASLEIPVKHLSGGNQQKVVLAKYLLGEPKVLFLDEPTRGIDVGAKAEIYNLLSQLAEQGMAIVMVSSELPEILGVCDRIAVLSRGRLTGEFPRAVANQENVMAAATQAA
ncbi:MAG: ATP-binding cassette domain-containing protein [Pseudomonadota bacterium]